MKHQQTRRKEDFELNLLQTQPKIENGSQQSSVNDRFSIQLCIFLTSLLCMISIIPITKVIIGIIHRDNCIIKSSIPIYMITSGIMEIIINFLTLPV